MDMTTLIAAAANAAGAAPNPVNTYYSTEYQDWKDRVLIIASDLATMVAGYETREARKAGIGVEGDVKAFYARLVAVEEITKGHGENTIRKGQLILEAHNSSNADEQGHETIETAPLGSPVGDEEFMRAQALVGQNVKIYKRNFLHPTEKSKKLKELVAIDSASGFSPAVTPVKTATPQPTVNTHLSEVREQLNSLEADEKEKFREFMKVKGRPLRAEEWTEEDLELIEGWLFGGAQ